MDRNIELLSWGAGGAVALRKESVDRNMLPLVLISLKIVALRKESVDRNVPEEVENYEEQVALRKESVDRNLGGVELG